MKNLKEPIYIEVFSLMKVIIGTNKLDVEHGWSQLKLRFWIDRRHRMEIIHNIILEMKDNHDENKFNSHINVYFIL